MNRPLAVIDYARLSSLAYEDAEYVNRAWSVAHGRATGDIADPSTTQRCTKKEALDPQHLEVLKRVPAVPTLERDACTDTKCYILRHTAQDGDSEVLCLVFRGTHSVEDVLIDADFLQSAFPDLQGVAVHRGFLAQYKAIRDKCDAAVADFLRHSPDGRIVCTGHSLGAAVATLAALHYGMQRTGKTYLATFGSPRVGNKAFVRSVGDSVSIMPRFKHGDDCVPKVPLEQQGYLHVIPETHIGAPDTHPDLPLFTDINDHAIDAYIQCMMTGTDPDKLRQETPVHKEIVGALMNLLHKWL